MNRDPTPRRSPSPSRSVAVLRLALLFALSATCAEAFVGFSPLRQRAVKASTPSDVVVDATTVLHKPVAASLLPQEPDTQSVPHKYGSLALLALSVVALASPTRNTAVTSAVVASSSLRYKGRHRFLPLLLQISCALRLLQQTLPRFGRFYMTQLAAFPVLTKSLTTAVIGVLGDALAQSIERRRTQPQHITYDRRRAISVFLDGCLVSGPFLHYGYETLERLIPSTTHAAALCQVLLDDIVLDAVFIALTFVTTAIGEGYIRKLPQLLTRDFWPTLRAGWLTSVFVMPIEFLCFRYLPLHFRVLGMNVVDIFWEGVVSFMTHKNRR